MKSSPDLLSGSNCPSSAGDEWGNENEMKQRAEVDGCKRHWDPRPTWERVLSQLSLHSNTQVTDLKFEKKNYLKTKREYS